MRARGGSGEVSLRFLGTYVGGYAIWLLYGISVQSAPIVLRISGTRAERVIACPACRLVSGKRIGRDVTLPVRDAVPLGKSRSASRLCE